MSLDENDLIMVSIKICLTWQYEHMISAIIQIPDGNCSNGFMLKINVFQNIKMLIMCSTGVRSHI